MSSLQDDRLGRIVFGTASAAYLALCVSVLRHSLVWLLGYVADDAFYYLQIARHLAASGRSTFDGLNPTNGYHPGWMLMMTGCARIFPDRVTLLKVSLGTEFGFHFATSLMVVVIVRRFADSFWAWIAGAVWLLSPLPFTLALYGVEAPFAQFAVLVCVWTYLARIAPFLRRGAGRPPVRHLALFGFSLALAFYGRTDQMLLAALACVLVAGLVWAGTPPGRRGKDAVRAVLWIGGAFAAGVLPWYLFSYLSCGMLTQDSGAMKMLWHVRSIPGWNIHTLVSGPLRFTLFFWLAAPFSALLTGSFAPHFLSPLLSLTVLGLVAAGIWAGSRRALSAGRHYAEDTLIQVTVWLGAAALISGYLYGTLMGDAQFWHLSVPSLSLFLLLACWGTRVARWQLKPEVQKRVGLAVFLAALELCILHQRVTPAPYPWQRDVYASEPRFEAIVPASSRIGSFDAGIPAYFSPRTVINLDGLVNHTAVAYWKTDTLDEYIAAQDIRYIANEPTTMAHAQKFTASPISLRLVSSVPLRGWGAGRRDLWQVEKRKQASQKELQENPKTP